MKTKTGTYARRHGRPSSRNRQRARRVKEYVARLELMCRHQWDGDGEDRVRLCHEDADAGEQHSCHLVEGHGGDEHECWCGSRIKMAGADRLQGQEQR